MFLIFILFLFLCIVSGPPKSVGAFQSRIFATIMQAIELETLVYAYPVPTAYSWYKKVSNQWKPVTSDSHMNITQNGLQSTLKFTNITVEDFGEYGVKVFNGLKGEALTKVFLLYEQGNFQTVGCATDQ